VIGPRDRRTGLRGRKQDSISFSPPGSADFGFRNPFAAVWGTVKEDVLILTGEHYCRGKPLGHHAAVLPRDVLWYADPCGANEREELRCAGFKVREGNNSLRPGIAAVTARLEKTSTDAPPADAANEAAPKVKHRPWLRLDNEFLRHEL
jgi:hypothetical protein